MEDALQRMMAERTRQDSGVFSTVTQVPTHVVRSGLIVPRAVPVANHVTKSFYSLSDSCTNEHCLSKK